MAGARSPLKYVYAARMTKAMMSGRSPEMPIPASTTWIPTSWSAMYGIVARMPVNAMASARTPLS